MKTETKESKYQKTIVTPIELKTWRALRETAFEKNLSMNEVVREALKKALKKNGKVID